MLVTSASWLADDRWRGTSREAGTGLSRDHGPHSMAAPREGSTQGDDPNADTGDTGTRPTARSLTVGGTALGQVVASSGTDDAQSKATTTPEPRLCVSPAVPSELAGIPPCSLHLGKLIGMRAALGDVIPGAALNPSLLAFWLFFYPSQKSLAHVSACVPVGRKSPRPCVPGRPPSGP